MTCLNNDKPTLFVHPKSTDELITEWRSQGLPLQETDILLNRLITERANRASPINGPAQQFNTSGSKYLRPILTTPDGKVDVYAVLDAFEVTSQPVGHALKKLLCAGQRRKGDKLQDLREARDAISRAIQMEEAKVALASQGSRIADGIADGLGNGILFRTDSGKTLP